MNRTNYYPRKNIQGIKAHKFLYFDHKNIETLKHFVNQFGQIEGRYRSMTNSLKPILNESQQKRLSRAVKRARFLALLPYIDSSDNS
ncbi:MAG: 30S ribosomal protein S18 [Candidatus Saccharibacteria bacterium]|nr:30S ribosomal protein S18 [Candidatus Saccharibacteria bacterium]MCY4010876.1 30S ribosomal protein S18 [Candidatus Saccharibacteria bacterium]MCY4089005.1 30S ribosomal protein S18 [Candidatus Saccharibacteria bacterium]